MIGHSTISFLYSQVNATKSKRQTTHTQDETQEMLHSMKYTKTPNTNIGFYHVGWRILYK